MLQVGSHMLPVAVISGAPTRLELGSPARRVRHVSEMN
jgi:hypothetical protein